MAGDQKWTCVAMTIDELIDEAAKLTGWKLTGYGDIRLSTPSQICCPITAVALLHGKRYRIQDWREAADHLGLTTKSAYRIARSADSDPTVWDDLRQKMLKSFNIDKQNMSSSFQVKRSSDLSAVNKN